MASRIVHFGADDCSRVIVFERAGYLVKNCGESLATLDSTLRQDRTEAVVISTHDAAHISEVVAVSRSLSPAPLVLFEGAGMPYDTSAFDLVIPPLTPPADWLGKFDQLLQKTIENTARSLSVRETSAALRKQSESVRLQSSLQRERASAQRESLRKIFDPRKH